MKKNDDIYSLKMRAASGSYHISGAEKLVKLEQIGTNVASLIDRALRHAKGEPELINLKIERIGRDKIINLEALKVTHIEVSSAPAGHQKLIDLLKNEGLSNAEPIVQMLLDCSPMRGAILLDVDTMERLEPDHERGIRVTYMDDADSVTKTPNPVKNHFAEAIVLATKVANAPNIIGELCISDDPDYVTGYFAGRSTGYVRITKLKNMGSPLGGRIFLYRGKRSEVSTTIEFLEKQCAVVANCPRSPMPPAIAPSPKTQIKAQLHDLTTANLRRHPAVNSGAAGPTILINNHPLLNLASNNYLDLANHPVVKKAMIDATERFGVGSTGSRLITGNNVCHVELEQRIAEFKGTARALLFNSGYMANVGILSALGSPESVIYSDELNHASIIDGCRLSRAQIEVYRHCDMADLETKIQHHRGSSGIIVSDAVFSMDGDLAPVPEIVALGRKYNLLSMIDEAHSTGVLGAKGHGVIEYFNLDVPPDLLMGTFSKAIGSMGGYVCATEDVIEYLLNTARSFIFSTALPAGVAAASTAAINLINSERVAKLHNNIDFFVNKLQSNGVNVSQSFSSIIPIIIGDEAKAVALAAKLLSRGLFLTAIRYPTVARGQARLRIVLNSGLEYEQLKYAADEIAKELEKKQ